MPARRFSDQKERKICDLYIREDFDSRQLARVFGCHFNTILYIIRKYGFKPRTRSEVQKGRLNSGWRGGIRDLAGYVGIYKPAHPQATKNKLVQEHRLVMEKHLGRFLLPDAPRLTTPKGEYRSPWP